MAGHSKWANIKHRKGAQDAIRAKVFAKFSKEIMVAVAQGGPDISTNPALRLVVSKAKAKSMPKANIEKAITKASGSKSGASNYKEYLYSGTLKHGIVFVVSCLSDNFNRLSAEMQFLFKKYSGSISKVGVIPYNFARVGMLEFEINKSFDQTLEELMDLDVIDIINYENMVSIITNPSELIKIKEELETKGYNEFKTAEITYYCNQPIQLSKEIAEKYLSAIEQFEDLEDIQEVYHNIDFSVLVE